MVLNVIGVSSWFSFIISDIVNGADCLSYAVLIHLLWPSRSILYLIKGDTPLPTFELEITGNIFKKITAKNYYS